MPRPINPADFLARPVIARDKSGRAYYTKQGRKLKLTPLQVVELAAWMKAKRYHEAEHVRTFGTVEQKARELGVSVSTVQAHLRNALRLSVRLGGDSN